MDDLLKYLVPVLVVGYFLYGLFRLFLYRKLNTERREYEKIVQDKMTELEQDIQSRSRDLQDSMQMINQEYSKLMKSMSVKQRADAENLMRKMEEFREKNPPKEAQDDVPPHSEADSGA